MDEVEKMSNEYHHAGPVGQFKMSAGKFGSDLLEIAELQGKLFKADGKLAVEKSVGAAIGVLLGACGLLGCVPVLILGLASAISYYFDLETWVSQLAVGCVVSLLCTATLVLSLKRLAKSTSPFQRSTDELSKNVEWAKDIFRGASSQ